MKYIYVNKLTIICSDNGLSRGWRQAIIQTNAGIWLTGSLPTIFSEISEICTLSFTIIYLKISYGKWRTFCFGHNVLSIASFRCLPMNNHFG